MNKNLFLSKEFNLKRWGICLLLFPFFVILFVVVYSLYLYTEGYPVIDHILEFLFFIASPISFGIGILLLIKNRDKHKSFLSKDVSKKRQIIGKIILFGIITPLVLLIIVIPAYFRIEHHFQNKCKEKYENSQKVLGETSEPKLIGSYGDVSEEDTFVWDWNWDREGYFPLNRFISDLEYYHKSNQIHLQDRWILKNGYELRMDCGKLDLTKIAPFDPYSCKLYYNDKLITDDLTYVSRCLDSVNYTSCVSIVKLVVYSESSSDSDANEYLVSGSWASGSKDWISFYKLNSGEFTLLPFKTEESEEDKWYISSGSFEFYGEDGDWEDETNFKVPLEFITYFHEPSMGATSGEYMNNVEGIFRIWEITEDSLVIKENVVDLYRAGEPAHWY